MAGAVESYDVRIRRDEVVRLLGLRRRTRPPRETVLRCLEEESAVARDLVTGRAVWTTVEQGLAGTGFLDPHVPIAVAVCTIGSAVEERAARLIDSGESARAMILDAIGSAAVEEVADHANGSICERLILSGRAPDRRRSPGYGGWDVREQRLLFDLLDPGAIGVALNSSSMMIPNKSISFVIPLEGGKEERVGRRCSRCGLTDCEYREL